MKDYLFSGGRARTVSRQQEWHVGKTLLDATIIDLSKVLHCHEQLILCGIYYTSMPIGRYVSKHSATAETEGKTLWSLYMMT